MASLKRLLPWVKRPLITVPPMAFVSRSEMTIAAAQAGAPAFLACGYDTKVFTQDLSLVLSALRTLQPPGLPEGLSPFGVGLMPWAIPISVLDHIFPMDGVTPHPAAFWLFAGKNFKDWTTRIREKSPETVIFIQVGSVEVSTPCTYKVNAKEAQGAKDAGADVIVAQGADAGGHGLINSASIISLVPEIISAVPGIPVLAAGGISDASGVLAGLALGADAVVMGTRFATSKESAMAEKAKNAILQTRDGGVSTKRTRLFDNLRGKRDWFETCDGRAIVNDTLRDWENGVSESELEKKYDTAVKEADYNRLVVYAGTGSGLVTKPQTVAEILDEVEEQFAEKVKSLNKHLSML